ncbi:molybdopterin molybdotransferase MoeA [Frigidibacter sp. RF13]|uniref:molybdopterin molybdotransferase MoeA n=1 Tax=Frigidibacter sp. RF13 TaxID=2997340 RepID=UPI00226E9A13|nr:gephyrin-like molybdotransferase Glp [Frigidibacter sp. RF13]MCY1125314.1 molybdopterin molybdotransferase MoeA [Frigidibacter sp. RF13]
MISVAEALSRILALAEPLDAETVPLRAAAGRVLSEAVSARLTQPPFNASAMDGYAIREADHVTGRRLKVIGEAGAGHAFSGRVGQGEAARIFTGAPVPDGAERVVLQEDVTRDGDQITLGDRLEQSNHIRPLGQDFRTGDRISAPRRLRPADLALIASMNVPDLRVTRRPVVAILSTGDELVMPGEEPKPDQIVASNTFAIAAMAEARGAEARILPIARDTHASLRQSFALATGADVIVTIGGASVGEHDHIQAVAIELGLQQNFWKIAMRPGKPVMAGRMKDAVLLGLPGNPVSAIVTAQLFLLPLLDRMQGLEAGHAPLKARLTAPLGENGPRAHYMRARLSVGDDLPAITPMGNQDSALLTILSEADALLIRPPGDPVRGTGDIVPYLPF